MILAVLGWCAVACLVIVFAAIARWTWNQWLIVTELAAERTEQPEPVPPPDGPPATLIEYNREWLVRRVGEKRARFAALVDDPDFPTALIAAVDTPTAEYLMVVQRQFGVRLDEVGPRELDCRRTEGWAQPTMELRAVSRG